jgi:hypothetical protein
VGDGLYGVFRLADVPTSTPAYSHCNTAVKKSAVAIMGDNDCVWDSDLSTSKASAGSGRGGEGSGGSKPTRGGLSAHAFHSDKSAAAMEIPFTAWPHLRTHSVEPTPTTATAAPAPAPILAFGEANSDDVEIESRQEIHTGCLEMEIWRSGYVSILDVMVGKCRLQLLPLLAHSGVAVERWFSIKDGDEQHSGMVLLRLLFDPSSAPAPAPSPSRSRSAPPSRLTSSASQGQGLRGGVDLSSLEIEETETSTASDQQQADTDIPREHLDELPSSRSRRNELTPTKVPPGVATLTAGSPVIRPMILKVKGRGEPVSQNERQSLPLTQSHVADSTNEIAMGASTIVVNDDDDDDDNVCAVNHTDEDEDLPTHPVDEASGTEKSDSLPASHATTTTSSNSSSSSSSPDSARTDTHPRRLRDREEERPLGSVGGGATAARKSSPTFSSEKLAEVAPAPATDNAVVIHEKEHEGVLQSSQLHVPPPISTAEQPPMSATAGVIDSNQHSTESSSFSATLSSWAYDLVYSSSTTHKKKNRSSIQQSPRSVGAGGGSAGRGTSPRRPQHKQQHKHAHLLETPASTAAVGGESAAAARASEVAARWRDIGEGVGSIYIHLQGAHKVTVMTVVDIIPAHWELGLNSI